MAARRLVSLSSGPNTIDGRMIVAFGKGLADRLLAFALGPGVDGLALRGRRRSRRYGPAPRPAVARGLGDVPRAVDMDGVHVLSNDAGEVDHRAGALDRPRDAVAVGDVGADEAELADLAERLDVVGVARLAGATRTRTPDLNRCSQT